MFSTNIEKQLQSWIPSRLRTFSSQSFVNSFQLTVSPLLELEDEDLLALKISLLTPGNTEALALMMQRALVSELEDRTVEKFFRT